MKKALSLAMAAAMIVVTLSACSTGTPASSATPVSSTGSAADSATPASSPSSSAETVSHDPFEKYGTPVTLMAVLGADAPEETSVPAGMTPETNTFIQICKDKLNVNIEFLWVTTTEQYQQKLQLSMSSGQMPDIFKAGIKEGADAFQRLINTGSLADLTQAYNDYALEDVKNDFKQADNLPLETATRDGKLYGIPYWADTRQDVQILYIRQDWLDNLKLQPPKTMQDVENIARAFVKDDPDQNGQADTYGLGATKNTIDAWFGGLTPFFYGYHAYPNAWIKDSTGNLVYGAIQPEMKNALAALQSWYSEGLLDREFATKDENQVLEDVAGGKIGLLFGSWWQSNMPQLFQIAGKDGGPVWKAYPLVSADSAPVSQAMKRVNVSYYNVVSKQCKNPEALIKVLNLYWDCLFNKGPETRYGDSVLSKNGFVYNYIPVDIYPGATQHTDFVVVNQALDADDPSLIITQEEQKCYDYAKNYLASKKTGQDWGYYYSRIAKDGAWAVTEDIFNQGNFVYNEFFGPTPKTQAEKGETLQSMRTQTFLGIIMGAPVSGFDKFVTDWKSLGGDQITIEVNEWYQQNK
jgi:putative aldouronate transport system substrate-binding protein